jgi:hypothetical protein
MKWHYFISNFKCLVHLFQRETLRSRINIRIHYIFCYGVYIYRVFQIRGNFASLGRLATYSAEVRAKLYPELLLKFPPLFCGLKTYVQVVTEAER